MGRLAGKVAIITGAGAGQGEAAAKLFAAEGAAVSVVDIRQSDAERVAAEINGSGGMAAPITVDVSEAHGARWITEQTLANFGKVDVLYNNAATLLKGTVVSMSLRDWDRTLAVNLTAPFLCAKFAIPAIVGAGGGSVINTASTSGLLGEPGFHGYGASKGGLISLTRHMAVEYARDGVRVNCICPGWIDTAMATKEEYTRSIGGRPGLEKLMEATVPMGRMGRPDEIAQVALFLASDASSLLTGHVLVADGGEHAAMASSVGVRGNNERFPST